MLLQFALRSVKPLMHNLKSDEVFVHSNSAVKEEQQQHFNPWLTSWVLITRKGNILVHSSTGGSRFPWKKRHQRDIFSPEVPDFGIVQNSLPLGFTALRTGTFEDRTEVTVPVLFALFSQKFFLSFPSCPAKSSSLSFASLLSWCFQPCTKSSFLSICNLSPRNPAL